MCDRSMSLELRLFSLEFLFSDKVVNTKYGHKLHSCKLSYYWVMPKKLVEGETGRRPNPIPTGQGRNQSLYECHVTKSGRNRVKVV